MGFAVMVVIIVRESLIQKLRAQMLRELDAAMDRRDVDRLEEAIRKGDAWAKRAPINHFMTQVSPSQPCLPPLQSSPWRQALLPNACACSLADVL